MSQLPSFADSFSGMQFPNPVISTSPGNLAAFNVLAGQSLPELTGKIDMSKLPGVTIPTIGGGSGGGFSGLGMGGSSWTEKAGLGLQALSTLIGGYAALKQLSLANKTFNFQKEFANANMDNSIKTYNTALADRARSRAAMEGQSQEQAQAYIDANKMSR